MNPQTCSHAFSLNFSTIFWISIFCLQQMPLKKYVRLFLGRTYLRLLRHFFWKPALDLYFSNLCSVQREISCLFWVLTFTFTLFFLVIAVFLKFCRFCWTALIPPRSLWSLGLVSTTKSKTKLFSTQQNTELPWPKCLHWWAGLSFLSSSMEHGSESRSKEPSQ